MLHTVEKSHNAKHAVGASRNIIQNLTELSKPTAHKGSHGPFSFLNPCWCTLQWVNRPSDNAGIHERVKCTAKSRNP